MYRTADRNIAREPTSYADVGRSEPSLSPARSVPVMPSPAIEGNLPRLEDAEQDIAVLLSSLNLQLVRRYMDQHYWHDESAAARAADRAEPGLKLENVAAHSWHVADAVMLLAPLFPSLDQSHAVELAILHDKLELFTGDFDPVGPDGQGITSHAFDPNARAVKTRLELQALEKYLSSLRGLARERQGQLISETIHGETAEARLVKAIDKLQALAFVLVKKAGNMTDEHLSFSLRYSHKAVEYFPGVATHYGALVNRLMKAVADRRNIALADLLVRFPDAIKAMSAGSES